MGCMMKLIRIRQYIHSMNTTVQMVHRSIQSRLQGLERMEHSSELVHNSKSILQMEMGLILRCIRNTYHHKSRGERWVLRRNQSMQLEMAHMVRRSLSLHYRNSNHHMEKARSLEPMIRCSIHMNRAGWMEHSSSLTIELELAHM